MTDDHAWKMEQPFWMAGDAYYRTTLDPHCVMAFPAPAGILAGAAITQALEKAPRWSSVAMSEKKLERPAPGLLVLAYRAEGRRDGMDVYTAFCTSTYRQDGGAWRLVQHQQTPT